MEEIACFYFIKIFNKNLFEYDLEIGADRMAEQPHPKIISVVLKKAQWARHNMVGSSWDFSDDGKKSAIDGWTHWMSSEYRDTPPHNLWWLANIGIKEWEDLKPFIVGSFVSV